MAAVYNFSCGILPTYNGGTLKAIKPDADGFYEVCVGEIGDNAITRGGVSYDAQSLIDCMSDPNSRFNICLRDGNLCGEYGHPVCEKREDIPRLLRIDEHYKSHYFKKIFVSPNLIEHNGQKVQLIMGLLKPCGPFGDILKAELEDPCHNTSFSIRTLCLPISGPDPNIQYRKVQLMITFDAVHAPGYDLTSKRHSQVAGTESFDYNRFAKPKELEVFKSDLESCVEYGRTGTEALTMVTDADIHRLFLGNVKHINGQPTVAATAGDRSIVNMAGNFGAAADLIYRR